MFVTFAAIYSSESLGKRALSFPRFSRYARQRINFFVIVWINRRKKRKKITESPCFFLHSTNDENITLRDRYRIFFYIFFYRLNTIFYVPINRNAVWKHARYFCIVLTRASRKKKKKKLIMLKWGKKITLQNSLRVA